MQRRACGLRPIFDEAKAREFYLDFLGFQVDWEHRFEPGLPLYMQVSKDGCVLHLSEHHGDCSPGAAMRIETSDHAELTSKQYKYHARQKRSCPTFKSPASEPDFRPGLLNSCQHEPAYRTPLILEQRTPLAGI
jgi:glyoxalase superfamily protein